MIHKTTGDTEKAMCQPANDDGKYEDENYK